MRTASAGGCEALKRLLWSADTHRMAWWDGTERRSGADRRRNVERRNGLAVLMAGCDRCGRIAPSPAEMHEEGWEIVADDEGLVRITCPAHGQPEQRDPDVLPDYVITLDER